MTNILIIGAGRSAGALIEYCLDHTHEMGWRVTVADNNLDEARAAVGDHPRAIPAWLDVTKNNDRQELIGRSDVVVSLLPAHLHLHVARDCVRLRKHLVTASYVSKELYRLGDEARKADLVFMGEMGLDPGLDHMSAMKTLNELRSEGATIDAFRSYTGGLVTPESANNPWRYKLTWSPRNVVLAGQGTAHYLENGKLRCIPYHRLFPSAYPVDIPGFEELEVYPNRDSLLYRDKYGLEDIPTLIRGTLRYPGFCAAWDALVQLGMTDANFPILASKKMTYHELMDSYAGKEPHGGSVKERVAHLIGHRPNGPVMRRLDWLGLFRKTRIKTAQATPALILQRLLEKRLKFEADDRDLVVMHHIFDYTIDGETRRRTSTLLLSGDERHTAMAKTVGLPMGIFLKLIAQGKISSRGVNIPVIPEVYVPVLEQLRRFGVEFEEHDTALPVPA